MPSQRTARPKATRAQSEERLKWPKTGTPYVPWASRRRDWSEPTRTFNPMAFADFGSRLDDFYQPVLDDGTVMIGGQRYKVVDDPRAKVLRLEPQHQRSSVELVQQRRAIERAQVMAQSPFAGIAYGVAALTNASARSRERALLAGAALDSALMAVAPRVAPVRVRAPSGRELEAPNTLRPNIRYSETTSERQPMDTSVTVTAPMLNTGTKVRWDPPGWRGDGNKYKEDRAHLHGSALGGLGHDRRNAVTLARGANRGAMRKFEREVMERVRAGEVVEYRVTPIYSGDRLAPEAILMMAFGSRREPRFAIIRNPAEPEK